jgi:hypothetical protein
MSIIEQKYIGLVGIMKKNALAKKFDLIFVSIVLYALLYIVYYALYRNTVFSLTLAFMTLAALHVLYWGLTRGRRERIAKEKCEREHCEAVFYSLPYLNEQALASFFQALFEKAGYRSEYFEGSLVVEKGGKRRAVFASFAGPCGEREVFSAEHLRQRADCVGFILLCDSLGEGARDALSSLIGNDNIALQRADIYALMKRHDTSPPVLYKKPQGKRSLKEIFSYMFKRERFKSFFLLALIMFLFSFVSPFKMYYLVFSGVLYIFCLFTLLFGGKREKVKSELDKV